MAEIDDGGMAFPGAQPLERDEKWNPTWDPGMTLRDWLVGQALSGTAFSIGTEPRASEALEWVVNHAEAIADEYIRRRAERIK